MAADNYKKGHKNHKAILAADKSRINKTTRRTWRKRQTDGVEESQKIKWTGSGD